MMKSLLSRVRPQCRVGSRSSTGHSRRRLAHHVRAEENPKWRPDPPSTVTRLKNGLRVATEAMPGSFSAVGVYIEAGSRFETESLRGASHLMDRLAFKSTTRRSSDEMLARVEALGGNMQCASSREVMMYQAATFNNAVGDAFALLAETIRYPVVTDQELQEQLRTAKYEIGEIWSKPDLILPEILHAAAFHDNTLGNPLLCPRERLEMINRDTIETYRRLLYAPDRMVVAFAGVPHATAVALVEEHFGDMQPASSDLTHTSDSDSGSGPGSYSSTSSSAESAILSSIPSPSATTSSSSPPSSPLPSGVFTGQLNRLFSKISSFKSLTTSATNSATVLSQMPSPALDSAAHYTGGFFSLPPLPPPPNPNLPQFSHIHLAFEGLPIGSDDIYALAALQTLLGGGGSFSAGGPGKGMFSRLYTEVLNKHGWVESCIAFNHAYTDSGLFGISGSCEPSHMLQMLSTMCNQLHALTAGSGHSALTHTEVSRAKNMLRSNLLMNLESRMIGLEDLGRQIQIHGCKLPTSYMCQRIEALTPDDLARVASLVVRGDVRNPGAGSGAPTVVMQEAAVPGTKTKLPKWTDMQEMIHSWGLGRNSRSR